MSDEKRRFTRVPFKVNAEVTVKDALYSAEEVKNLSVGGCLLPITADLERGNQCQVRIVLTGASSELSIRVDGEVMRCAPGAVAIKFVRIDPDSLFHLQNIIRYNAPDADTIEVEIREHVGLT